MSRTEKLKKQIGESIDVIKMKNCPICGAVPSLEETDLDRGNGHGYPGCFTYLYKCPRCGLLESERYIYDRNDKSQSQETVKNLALKDWNELVDYINQLIDKTRAKLN